MAGSLSLQRLPAQRLPRDYRTILGKGESAKAGELLGTWKLSVSKQIQQGHKSMWWNATLAIGVSRWLIPSNSPNVLAALISGYCA